MRKQLLLLLLLSLLSLPGLARVVTGVVTQSSDGEPIIGASVKVHGTTRGTATDFDGRFSIEANDGDVLDVSYVGMNPKSVKIAPGQTVVNIALEDNAQVLGEVVVTAMGQTQEKKKLNFAVQSLDEEQVTAGGSTPGEEETELCRSVPRRGTGDRWRFHKLRQHVAGQDCRSASKHGRQFAQLLNPGHHPRHFVDEQLPEQRAVAHR